MKQRVASSKRQVSSWLIFYEDGLLLRRINLPLFLLLTYNENIVIHER